MIDLQSRKRREYLFKTLAKGAFLASLLFLFLFLGIIFSKGWGAFVRTNLSLDLNINVNTLGISKDSTRSEIKSADFSSLVYQKLYSIFPEVTEINDKRQLKKIISPGAANLVANFIVSNPKQIGNLIKIKIPLASNLDQLAKGNIDRKLSETRRPISDQTLSWYDSLVSKGMINKDINWSFFKTGDSREPELAGIMGAILGSLYSVLICFLLAFPLGLASAIYLEKFAPKNKFTSLIEVNVNNLAAVPSIIFGLLGLAVFLNFFNLPRGTPLVGGMVLALMTLPVIVVAARAAIRAVPPSVTEGALALGATKMQAVFHHVVPLALPGTLTGSIIGLSRALGETGPLLMIGMIAFIADLPKNPLQPAAPLPVQIYLWSESAERGFIEKTSAAIMVILTFLFLMNLVAVIIRNRFEKRW